MIVSGYTLLGQKLTGKTSDLNIISDRISVKDGMSISGSVVVNDTLPLKQEAFGKFGAYAMQDYILYQYFTPKEALTFGAILKLGCSIED